VILIILIMKNSKIDDEKNVAYLKENYGKNILPLSLLQNEYVLGTEPLEILFFWNKESTFLETKESIFRAVRHYNIFSSRLIQTGQNKFALQYCKDGFKFNFLPFIDDTFDNINIEDIKKKLVKVKTLPGESLFAVTVIPVKGGRFVGISCSDAVADVFALILLCFAWKSIIERKRFLRPSPQRLFKGKPADFDKTDKTFIPSLSELSNAIQKRVRISSVKKYTKREYFTDELLNELQLTAKSKNEKCIISRSQIITSLLLKKYHDIISPDAESVVLRNPINLREVHPDVDPMYIGNAFFDNTTRYSRDEIERMSIYEIAYRLNESISNVGNEEHLKKISYLSDYGIEFKKEVIKNYSLYNMDTDIVSSNLIALNDPESLGISSNLVNILNINASPTSFVILKEKDGRIFAQITSIYPLTF